MTTPVPLDRRQLAYIRLRYAAGGTVRRIARKVGVIPACVEAIVKGRPWRHLAVAPERGRRAKDLFGA